MKEDKVPQNVFDLELDDLTFRTGLSMKYVDRDRRKADTIEPRNPKLAALIRANVASIEKIHEYLATYNEGK